MVQRFAANHGVPLLTVLVGDRKSWKNPSHPLRNDPNLPITSVPSAVAWVAPGKPDGVIGSALERATSEPQVQTLLQDLLQQQK